MVDEAQCSPRAGRDAATIRGIGAPTMSKARHLLTLLALDGASAEGPGTFLRVPV
jgi:hypothetical protein